jgi:hypothetical protein
MAPPATARIADRAAATTLTATLGPSGDVDGSGHAMVTLNRARQKVCATIHWTGIEEPDFAHIHKKSDGSIAVDLTGAVTGGARCTRGVSRRTITRILERPRRFYVNVHNSTYPAGAIQGSLHR